MSEKSKEPRFYGDVTEKSHKNMSRIKGKDTSIEIALRKALWKRGYRYRKNFSNALAILCNKFVRKAATFSIFP